MTAILFAGLGGLPPPSPARVAALVERNVRGYIRGWAIIVSGFFEPVFYLLSIGIGLGRLVGRVNVGGGHTVTYAAFVAPAMMASAATNGALLDATYNMFFKLKYSKLYDAILSTPLGVADIAVGEVAWSLLRGALYSTVFLALMGALGLVHSVWALAALPVAFLVGFAFAAVGMAFTTYLKSWQDFEWIQLAILPMFLFSGTFYPLSRYPGLLRAIVSWTPLYQAVALLRGLVLGNVDWALVGHVGYLLVMGAVGVAVCAARLERLLLR
jgi:lipooligosaccharide transport system permease protein